MCIVVGCTDRGRRRDMVKIDMYGWGRKLAAVIEGFDRLDLRVKRER